MKNDLNNLVMSLSSFKYDIFTSIMNLNDDVMMSAIAFSVDPSVTES